MANEVGGTLILQAAQSDISPDILLPMTSSTLSTAPLQNPSSAIVHPVPPAFSNKVSSPTSMAGPMHVGMSVYMPPMDVAEPSSSTVTDLLVEYPPACDPFTSSEHDMITVSTGSAHSSVSPPLPQVPSPGLPPPFNVPQASSLASPLVPSLLPSTSQIMLSNTEAFPLGQDVSMTQPLSTLPTTLGDGSIPPSEPQAAASYVPPLFDTLENVLDSVIHTANSAKVACQNHQAAEASNNVNAIHKDMSVVSRLVNQLMSQLQTVSLSGDRKRCASAVESERMAKALKREPVEDGLLLNDGVITPDGPLQIAQPLPGPAGQSSLALTGGIVPLSAPSGSPPIIPFGAAPPFHVSHPSHSLAVSSIPSASTLAPVPVPPASAFTTIAPSSLSTALVAPPGHDEGAPLLQPSTIFPPGFGAPTAMAPLEYAPASIPSMEAPGLQFPQASPGRQAWSQTIPIPKHRHSLSAGSLNEAQPVPHVPPFIPHADGLIYPTMPVSPATSSVTSISPIGRMSRSGSISGQYTSPFGYPIGEHLEPTPSAWPEIARGAGPTSAPTVMTGWNLPPTEGSNGQPPSSRSGSASASAHPSPEDEDESEYESGDDGDDGDMDETESPNRSSHHLPLDGLLGQHSSSSDVPQEYLSEVNRIFFEFLNRICSDETAVDSKNDKIHQSLMPKKMLRLAESPDFRPFKFRIQAFTHAFLEELAAQGYPEEKIPMKKIRNYLWKQPLILRFNPDGKKAKSKGNHIWQVDAKKLDSTQWEFRPFVRNLAGKISAVAYCGLRWEYTPSVWDPQASWTHVPVQYSSPSLPPWLSWKDGVLSGVPPPDAQTCEITVIAKYVWDGQEGQLTRKFTVNIAPVSTIETSFSQSRRPSFGAEPQVPRRRSDSMVQQAVPRPVPPAVAAPEPAPAQTQVVRVLQTAAHRVAQERQHSQRTVPTHVDEVQDLVKQQHVLSRVASVIDAQASGQPGSAGARQLAAAAHSLVFQAAQTVLADKTSVSGMGPAVEQNNITISEVSNKTQGAVAQAVKLHGTTSKEFDVVITATNILKDGRPSPVSPSDDGQMSVSELPRPHTAGSLSSRSYPSPPVYNSFSAPPSTNVTP
ncbi:hypothetical protein HGRIS_012861 [Hohenbuehelia grisea]|uniref:Uncharacterized protein n=1 Tax=Hohenbuehelia grisea TaxID=104357 RepID=A0ABR3ITQ8_9AGAR